MTNPTLAQYAEQISDDFQSTFTVVNDNMLANMMSPDDFEPLTKIIHNYLPDLALEFKNTKQLGMDRDIYLVAVKSEKNTNIKQ